MISKEKIIDSMSGKPKAFEEIKHEHVKAPTRLQSLQCERCRYDRAEESLLEKIDSLKDDEVTKLFDSKGVPKGIAKFQNLHVLRGRLDDVIGWTISWL